MTERPKTEADKAPLERLRDLLTEANLLMTQLCERAGVRADVRERRSGVEEITRALRESGGWMLTREIVARTGFTPGFVRSVLHKRQDLFERRKPSRMRCMWRLREQASADAESPGATTDGT